MIELTKTEEIFLLTIWRLKDNAYGVTIKEGIREVTGKDYTYGTLYGVLDQLDRKGYVSRKNSDPTPERGGRSKTFYNLSPLGIKALKNSIEIHKAVWNGISEFTFDEGKIL